MSIADNVAIIKENIARAAREAGRDPKQILLGAATKMNDTDAVRQALAAGVDCCGENRVQELTQKLSENAYEGAPVHFIGHLQTNKVKQVVGRVSVIESVDSERLAAEINRRSAALGIVTDILVEVNSGREENKGGIFPENVLAAARQFSSFDHLQVRGLMTMAPVCVEKEEYRKYFKETYSIFIDFLSQTSDNIREPILSMGMSDSYEIAVEEGATEVRVGSALFGRRIYPQTADSAQNTKKI